MMFFDSYAILEIINGNSNYEKYSQEIIITNYLNLSEIFYSLLKRVNEKIAKQIIENLDIEFINMDKEISINAALFKEKHKKKKLSYADCIGYVTALKSKLKFLTGDKEFKKLNNVEFVRK